MNEQQQKELDVIFRELRTMQQDAEAYKLALFMVQNIIQQQAYNVDMKAFLKGMIQAANYLLHVLQAESGRDE